MDLHAKVDDDDVVGVIRTVDDFFGSVKEGVRKRKTRVLGVLADGADLDVQTIMGLKSVLCLLLLLILPSHH